MDAWATGRALPLRVPLGCRGQEASRAAAVARGQQRDGHFGKRPICKLAWGGCLALVPCRAQSPGLLCLPCPPVPRGLGRGDCGLPWQVYLSDRVRPGACAAVSDAQSRRLR